jgi:peptidyl-prolyl cis-trans isomerase C
LRFPTLNHLKALNQNRILPMLLRLSASALFLAGVLSMSFVQAETPKAEGATPVASVNGKPITEAELSIAKSQLAEALEGLPEEARKEQLIDYMVTLRLVADEARKQKIDSVPDYNQQLAFATDKMLMEMLLRREVNKAVSPAAIKAFYNERVKAMKSEMEVHARHILLPTEEEAKAAMVELKKGKDFIELAKSLSKDPATAQEGGDLGYFTKDRMVPEFAEAAFKGSVGKVIPEPVKSRLGWHIIKIEDKRPQQPPELATVEPQIRAFLTRKAQADFVTNLRKEAKIERPEAPSPAAAGNKIKSN